MGNDVIGHPAAKLIRKLYVSPSGTMVLGNVWICKSAMGLPLDIVFECLKNNNAIPHWPQFIEQAIKEGINPDKLLSETKTAVIDVWGYESWKELNQWLKNYYS